MKVNIINITLLGIISSFISISHSFGQSPNENDSLKIDQIFSEADTAANQAFDTTDFGFSINEEGFNKKTSSSPLRLGIRYESNCKVSKPAQIKNNRFS